MHLKRNKTPKIWPIKRKGTKYVIRNKYNPDKGVPLLIILRDKLGVAKTAKEAKHILLAGKARVNGEIAREESYPLSLFDVLSLENANYKIIIKNKKIDLEEIKGKESETKIYKVIGKKVLSGKRIQINLNEGRNCISNEKARTGDSVVISFKDNKITEVLALKEGCKILFIDGKHIGEEGKVEKIEGKSVIASQGKEKVNTKLNMIMVVK